MNKLKLCILLFICCVFSPVTMAKGIPLFFNTGDELFEVEDAPAFDEGYNPNSSPKCDTLQFKRLASFLQKPWLAA